VNRALEYDLIARVQEHVRSRTTDRDEPGSVPVAHYLDPERYRTERERVFACLPIAIGHTSMIPEPGDYFTHETLGFPIVVVRGDDGHVRAMLNVCRHRGTQVVPSGCGKGSRAFACPYHAWTYDRSGRLTGVPHPHGFPGLRREDRGLVQLRTEVVAGLIFVTREPANAPTAREHLGSIADDLESYTLGSQHAYARQSQERALNWKLGIDVFLETYHLRPTHADTIFPMFFDNIGLVDRIGANLRNVFPKRTIRDLDEDTRASWSLRQHANILYHLFPNTLVLVQPDHTAVLHLFPTRQDITVIESYTLVPEEPDERARRYWDANNAILYGATAEDFERGESIQRGLASGANAALTFAAYEHALTHFHAHVDAQLGGPRTT
jgi:phenylpropionate dioxygenase-like ring-hydroxylating dioxygenase large terminal subunit